jgi:signal transduction histidine kinase
MRRWLARAWWLPPALLLAAVVGLQYGIEIERYRIGYTEAGACSEGLRARPKPLFNLAAQGRCHLLRATPERSSVALEGAALVLAGVHRDAAVYLNGVQLREVDLRFWQSFQSSTLLIPLPSSLLQRATNELIVEVRAGPQDIGPLRLQRSYFGPRAELARWHQRISLLQQTGAQLCSLLILIVAIFLLPMAISRPEARYGWYGLSLTGALLYVSLFVSEIRPLPVRVSHLLTHGGLLLSLYAMSRFSLALLGAVPSPWLNRAALAAGTGLLLSQWPVWPPLRWLGDGAFRLSCLGLLIALLLRWWRGRDVALIPNGRWFVSACVLLLLFGMSDSARAILGERWISQIYLLHWGILYLVALIFAALIANLLGALTTSELSREQLQSALDARTAELNTEFARRQSAEQARTLAEERQRIMRDMHDGVGGQLVALICQLDRPVEPDDIKGQLKRTLEDLRLMIDSLDLACADLSVALGMLRTRLDGLQGSQPVRILWRTAHLPDLPSVSPAVVLHVLRVVQEAITNALKHAHAREIEISADYVDGALGLRIRDDGVGVEANATPGRGLASMRARAQAIGADFALHSDRGTCVELRLAL